MYEEANDRGTYPDHQLMPVKGGRYATVFHGPPGTDVGDLHCDLEPYVQGDRPATINHSGWLPTEEQIAMLSAGAHVRLSVWQHPIPPLAVSVEPPVDADGSPMIWDGATAAFLTQALAQSTAERRRATERQVREDFTPQPPEG